MKLKNNAKNTVLFSSENSIFYLKDPKEGKLGFSRDGYDYLFNYSVESGKKVKIAIQGTNKSTALYVDGLLIEILNVETHKSDLDRKDKRKWVQTLVFPFQKTGKFNGKIENLKVEFI